MSSCLCHMDMYASLWTSWKLMCEVKLDLLKDFDLINRRIMRDSSIKPSTETIKLSQASRCWLTARGCLNPVCNGGDYCCNDSNKCGIGEGDCDTDKDCHPGLTCGINNCIGASFEANDDCCYSGEYSIYFLIQLCVMLMYVLNVWTREACWMRRWRFMLH